MSARNTRSFLFGTLVIGGFAAAFTFGFGVKLGPEDALRFARGEEVTSTGGLKAQLERPLDFLVIADHSAAAPYRLLDITEVEADVVALNASAWGGPPVGALVFRDPGLIDTLTSVSTNPRASGAARLELGAHQYGMLAGLVASVEYLAGMDEDVEGSRRERLTGSMESAANYLDGLFDYLIGALRSMPMVSLIGDPSVRIPVVSFVVDGVPADRVVQRLVDNGVLVISNSSSRVLEALGVNEIGGAVTVGLAHYTTAAEVDHLVRALASLG
jgi:selenocysteine lyase/cysteine desulfurase